MTLMEQCARYQAVLEAIAKMPCINELLGEKDPEEGCGCASCEAGRVLFEVTGIVPTSAKEDAPG